MTIRLSIVVALLAAGALADCEFVQQPVSGEVHASTLLPLRDGGYVAAWFGGSKEGASDGCLYLTLNTASGDKAPRNVLEIWRSSDDGKSWSPWRVLEKEEKGEFSYPCLIESKPGTLAVTYTWNRRRIAFREYAQPALADGSEPDWTIPADGKSAEASTIAK